MTDIVDSATRSRMMSGIRGTDTKPELTIRRALHALGFRYKLHDKHLPGKPDLVFPKYRAVIFVNGCFWHGHDCHLFKWPKTRHEFWRTKISNTRQKDKRNIELLIADDWRVMELWECALKGKYRLSINSVIEAAASWLISDEQIFEIRGGA